MDDQEFWFREGVQNIIPPGFGEFPEGFDVRETLKSLTHNLEYRSVIDFGCGYGRLCESFEPHKYLGVDINEDLLAQANMRFQGYRFEPISEKRQSADIYLAYTVFLHMKDRDLQEALKKMRCKWLIVAEILGKEWRREGEPPVYNRDLSDYVEIMRSHDLILDQHERIPYKKYADTKHYQDKNTDISFLLFKKCFRKHS